MKKIAIIAGTALAANTAINLGVAGTRGLIAHTGGTAAGLLFLASPFITTPAPAMVRSFLNELQSA